MNALPEKRFYVYFHVRKDDGQIFYVGKGTAYRAWETKRRNVEHSALLSSVEYDVVIYKDNLTNEEALTLESEQLLLHKTTVVNKVSQKALKNINRDDIAKYLSYDETSPSSLRWIAGNKSKIRSGDVAGTIDLDGYYKVKIHGKSYSAHRLVLELAGTSTTGRLVEHIDKDRQNNAVTNLRVVTRQELTDNKPISVRTVYHKGYKYYSVLDKITKKPRRFSVSKHGDSQAYALAFEFLQTNT